MPSGHTYHTTKKKEVQVNPHKHQPSAHAEATPQTCGHKQVSS